MVPTTKQDYAEIALNVVSARFPQGAANQVDTFFSLPDETNKRYLKESFICWFRDIAEKWISGDQGVTRLSPIDDLLDRWLTLNSQNVNLLVAELQSEYLDLSKPAPESFCPKTLSILTGLLATLRNYSNGLIYMASKSGGNLNSQALSITTLVKTLTFGNCLMFVDYALGYLRNKYPTKDILFAPLLMGTHAMLFIGDKKEVKCRNISKPSKWGVDFLVCDPWINRIYTRSEFLALNAAVLSGEFPVVDYMQPAIDSERGCVNSVQLFLRGNRPYLMGQTPELDLQRKKYDQIINAWVEQEQREESKRRSAASLSASASVPAIFAENHSTLYGKMTERCVEFHDWKLAKDGEFYWKRFYTAAQAEEACKHLADNGIFAEISEQVVVDKTVYVARCNKASFDEHFSLRKEFFS